MPKQQYDRIDTLARMAGNIADGILSTPQHANAAERWVAKRAVTIAKLILKEIEGELGIGEDADGSQTE